MMGMIMMVVVILVVLYCIFVYSQTWLTRRTHLQ